MLVIGDNSNFQKILVKILETSRKIAVLLSLIVCLPLVSMLLESDTI